MFPLYVDTKIMQIGYGVVKLWPFVGKGPAVFTNLIQSCSKMYGHFVFCNASPHPYTMLRSESRHWIVKAPLIHSNIVKWGQGREA